MGELGCFPITNDFIHPKYRPINLSPSPRDFVNTKFELYTKRNPRRGYQMFAWNGQNLAESPFSPLLPSKFVIPGFLDGRFIAKWVRDMRDALVRAEDDYNVFVVEWTNITPYTLATANTRVVGKQHIKAIFNYSILNLIIGAEIANMIEFLIDYTGVKPSSLHLIGHSLG